MSTGPRTTLDIVLTDLQRIVGTLALNHERQANRFIHDLSALTTTIETLGNPVASKPLRCPDEYIKDWQRLCEGTISQLSSRAVRYLCWQPPIATQEAFHDLLLTNQILSGRTLQGLVWSYHARYSPRTTQRWLDDKLRSYLHQYDGPNRMITKWQQNVAMIIGTDASGELAAWVHDEAALPAAAAKEWGIDEQSPFFARLMKIVLQLLQPRLAQDQEALDLLITNVLTWEHWRLEDFKEAIASTILHVTTASAAVREQLKTFLLADNRLGDPRLPANNHNWLGMQPNAKARFIEWLSKDDIVFFFEHAFPNGTDAHRRKPFWLDYVGSVKVSRPLLCRLDLARLRAHERRTQTETGNYGSINGNNSAFVLDFGTVVAIEFSHIGACYLYERRNATKIVEELFQDEPFTEHELKRKHLCVERIRHISGWEHDLRNALARYGVRSTSTAGYGY